MSGFGSFGYDAPLSPEQEAASERWRAAGDPYTPEETLLELAFHPDPQVASTLALNAAASALVLTTLCRQHPEVEELARLNRNAPPDMKDGSPLSEHSEDSLSVYLEQRNASLEHRARFIRRFRALRAPGGPTVAEVFESTKDS